MGNEHDLNNHISLGTISLLNLEPGAGFAFSNLTSELQIQVTGPQRVSVV